MGRGTGIIPADANPDQVYEKLVSVVGLYGQTFFGHKRTRTEGIILERLWQVAQLVSSLEVNEDE